MTHFIQSTLTDIRTGRETWRVFAMLSSVAFSVAVAVKLI
jgi:hypothetical protein